MLFRRESRAIRHERTLMLEYQAIGWTVLRAVEAAKAGDVVHVEVDEGYRTIERFPDYAVQVSNNGDVLFTFNMYRALTLTIVEPSHHRCEKSQQPCAYNDALLKYERKLIVAIDRMRDIDPVPVKLEKFACFKKRKRCDKELRWSDSYKAFMCPDHYALKRREVKVVNLDPFENVPSLSRR